MCVRFLRNTESPHVSVFYQAWVSLVIALCATLIPRALGHTASIRQVHGWVEWTFMAGVGEAADCWAWCRLLSMLVQLVAACNQWPGEGRTHGCLQLHCRPLLCSAVVLVIHMHLRDMGALGACCHLRSLFRSG